MAAPLPSKIILPLDTGNTGKNVRTQTRVVGGDVVHEHYWVRTRQGLLVSNYRVAFAPNTVVASAQNGTTTGMLWGHMPSTVSGKAMRLRWLSVSSHASTNLATPTAPRLVAQRYTSSGALSSSPIAPTLNDSVNASTTPACLFSLANTGTTVVLVGIGFGSTALIGSVTAVGSYHPVQSYLVEPSVDEDHWPVFYPGEGFVVWQDTAGTSSDTRKINIVLAADEIDTA